MAKRKKAKPPKPGPCEVCEVADEQTLCDHCSRNICLGCVADLEWVGDKILCFDCAMGMPRPSDLPVRGGSRG